MDPKIITDLLESLAATSPEDFDEVVASGVETYKPYAYAIGNQILNIFEDLVSNERFFELMASYKYNMYNAYVNAGFTKPQAFQLMLSEDKNILGTFVKEAVKVKANEN